MQNNLEGLKRELSKRGYTVVDIAEYNSPVDAYLYESYPLMQKQISDNNIPSYESNRTRNSYGVLLVNSKGKSVSEIEHILKKRVYSPLF